ncbi:hypothetical protein C5715_25675, partial [Escherichia coli]
MERGEKKTRASFYFFGASSGLFTPLQDVAKFREGVSKNLTEGKINILRHSRRFFKCACKAL